MRSPGFNCAKLLVPLTVLIVAALALTVSPVEAQTVAWWRFGDDPSDPNFGVIADADWLQPTSGRTAVDVDPEPFVAPAYIPGYDSSGNGNTLFSWDAGGAGMRYRNEVSSPTSAATDDNAWSIQNEFLYPAAFTWSQQASPTGVDLQTFAPSQWTIEASVKPTTLDAGAYHTFVGREGNDVIAGGDANSAPLYFQITDATNGTQFRINYTDAAGVNHIATSSGLDVIENQWYHVAATSDGSTLSLYVDQYDGTGYQLAATADLTLSANSAMIDPGLDANSETWGWTVGRGRYGTNDDPTADHGDRFFGNIDEVRISGDALTPGNFLFTGQDLNRGPQLQVDRDTGAMTLVNLQDPIALVSYNITSASGSLAPGSWNSIADNQDVDSGAGPKFDDVNEWFVDFATNDQLMETEPDGTGGQLGSVQLGNAWTPSLYEDLQVTVDELVDGSTVTTTAVPVVFTGNGGEAFIRSDLDLDGDVDSADWIAFAANHLTDLSALTVAAASVLGDLDGDLDNDFSDFRIFQADYDGINGAGALAATIAAIPEPATALLLLVGLVPVALRSRRARS